MIRKQTFEKVDYFIKIFLRQIFALDVSFQINNLILLSVCALIFFLLYTLLCTLGRKI